MTSDPTEHQSTEAREKSQDLSRQRAGAPIEVPGYETRKFLGAGAYGEVWVAVDQNTGRRVAIKFFMHRGGLDWSLLSSEVEKLVFLSADRYVVQLLDVGWDSEPPYYVMEYVENGSLEDYLRQQGTLPVGEAMEIFREIAIGLSRAHGKGVLHCDLKPANILLDQDHKPRLADFGQSRLTHEQTPALGTLFFMAPEQADLSAVPDARWDVYALGAVLHTMLTGKPPYRSEQAISELDSTINLDERLESYRRYIEESNSNEASKIKGVDRSAQGIVERCLAVDPEQRYPNVQSVLDAISSRDAQRDRRPLVLLGLVGPLLFLLVTGLFAWRGHAGAVRDADRLLLVRAQETNQFAAQFVAEAVARRIESYFRAVEEVAQSGDFLEPMQAFVAQQETLLKTLRKRDTQELSEDRLRFQALPSRQRLDEIMQQLLDNPERKDIASWFATDEHGVQIASAFDSQAEQSSVGGDYAYRTYFHGGAEDLPRPVTTDVPPIERTHFSTVFRSTATNAWKVAISTPIMVDNEFKGIVALTIELGRLGELLGNEDNQRQFSVLVDGRPGETYGVILQHPLLARLRTQRTILDPEFSESDRYRVQLDQLPRVSRKLDHEPRLYRDPMGEHPEGQQYRQQWIVASHQVRPNGAAGKDLVREIDTGLVVIVQEDYSTLSAAVHQLSQSLLNLGLLALTSVMLLVVLLWYSVARALADPNETVRRQGGPKPSPSTINTMETIELPKRLKR